MSVNQARVERQGQLRKPSRSGSSGQPRGFIGGSNGGGKDGGGGGGSAPSLPIPTSAFAAAASPSSVSASLSTNRSFKKSGNGHGVQYRVNSASANPDAGAVAPAAAAAQRVVQNGALDPVPSADALPASGAKLGEMPMPRNAPRAIPKAPASQSATVAANSQMSLAMPKGDSSRNFTLQFGTINPGLVNGLQIPARTSSAPPNLDEQKRDQVRAEVYRDAPAVPIPSVPKQQHQQQTRKDVGVPNQFASADSHHVTQIKRDVSAPVPSSTVLAPPSSSVLPISGRPVPMARPCQPQQPQVPPQFGGPSSQLQPPGLVANSMQMTITIPVGNDPQVAQQIFMPAVQPHFVQQQAIMHQGQGLGYASPIAHQFPQQLSNMGMGISSQFTQQQSGRPFGPRKTTVKITHPETHEELRLDKRSDSFKDSVSSGLRPQAQPIPAYTAPHQMSYYHPMQQNSYGPTALVFPASLPLTSGQVPMSSQAQKYSYPVTHSGQNLSFTNSSMTNNITGGKPAASTPSRGISEGVNLEGLPVSVSVSVPASVQNTAKPHVTISMPVNKAEATKLPKTVVDAMASYQRSKVTPDGRVEKLKSGSEPPAGGLLPVTDTSSSAAAPLPPTQRVLPQALSTPKITSGDVRPDLFGSGNKKPAGPLKNNEKNESTEDLRNSPQHQLDASSSGGIKLSLLRTAEGSSMRVPTTQEGYTRTENIGLASDLVTSSTWPSLKAESKVIPEIRSIEPFEGKEIPAASGISGLEKEKGEEACLGHSSLCLPTDGVSFKEVVPSEVTASLGSAVDGTYSKTMDSNSNTISRVLEVRRVEMLEDSDQSETSNASSQDSNEAKVHPSPSVAKSSMLTDQIMLLKQDDVDEKVEFSKNAEFEKTLCYPKEEVKRVNKQNGTVASLEITAVDCDIPSVDDKDSHDTTKCERQYSKDNSRNDSCLIPMTAAEAKPSASLIAQKLESEVLDLPIDGMVSARSIGRKEKPSLETLKPKITTGKKKKRKEMLSKADAAGSSDLYNAFKGPEEKPEVVSKLKSVGSPTADTQMAQVDYPDKDVAVSKEDGQNKADLDDWENAADILTPKLKTPQHGQLVDGARKLDDEVSYETTSPKKYSRDFLMTLSQQFVELPVGFAVGSDIADALMSSPLAKSPYSSPGRTVDRPSGASRVDRRMAGNLDDDRWTRSPASSGHGRDCRLDVGYGVANINLRPGQGVGHGVLKNPRGQASNQFGSGILSGPVQSLASQGGMPRGGPDVDRWQRTRGLIPSPQTPMQVMHKAEQRYEVRKVTDEEQAKQRQLKGILNKLTPQNFDKLFAQVKEVNIDNAVTLTGVISQIFDKALMEPTFCEMYANFCFHLSGVLPDFIWDNEKITFKRLLLNKCQEEFERGEIEQAEADKAEEEGEIKQSIEEREEKRLRARKRMLGNIRLIGELYKKKMLTERIMHECIKKLLGQCQNPDEEDIEALCKLMSTIGAIIDHPKAKEHMDAYFDMMTELSTNQKLSSRVRFMLRDAIDLRRNKWQQRRKVEGPKKIEEVHRDAAQERQNQSSRLGRGAVISNVPRRGQAVDYGSRGTTASSSPNSQLVGGLRGVPSQARGYGNQDVRSEDRNQFETRTMLLPLAQRSDDNNITLGPQGGLVKGMSFRGHSSGSNAPAAEIAPAVGDRRRMIAASNGSNYSAHRVSGTTHGQLSPLEGNNYLGSREKMPDHAYEKSIISVGRTQGTSGGSLTAVSEPRTSPEEVLQEKSISAIREFYSAKDENEVVLCIKELNAPSFYPSIISLWVTDSFERKGMERDLLSELIINLCKSRESLLNQVQLLQGFELVLSSLEDAVNDAPKAAEFLGRTFAKVVMENLVPLSDIGRLLREGGEEPGRLREIGLAAEVLGSILETIGSERGGTVLNEIQTSSNLQLEDFRPLHPMKSKLEAFL